MPGRNFTDAEEAEIARRYLAGESAKAIGRSLGKRHHISIVAALRRQGVERRTPGEDNRSYTVNIHAFDDLAIEQAAYWLGFIYADATVYRNTVRLAVAQNDRDHLLNFLSFMESNAPCHDITANCSNGNTYPQVMVEVSGRHLMQQLKKSGIVVGRSYPHRLIRNVPAVSIHHCIRGYFDGDGSARKNGSISICGDQVILAWIRQSVANAVGTNPNLSLTKHTKSDLYYLYFSRVRPARKFADYIYRDATVWLGRKRQVVDSWPQPCSRPLFPNGYKRRTKTTD